MQDDNLHRYQNTDPSSEKIFDVGHNLDHKNINVLLVSISKVALFSSLHVSSRILWWSVWEFISSRLSLIINLTLIKRWSQFFIRYKSGSCHPCFHYINYCKSLLLSNSIQPLQTSTSSKCCCKTTYKIQWKSPHSAYFSISTLVICTF